MTNDLLNSLKIKSGKISLVIREAAVGMITLEWMLFFAPSIARVLERPIRPIFAALKLMNSLSGLGVLQLENSLKNHTTKVFYVTKLVCSVESPQQMLFKKSKNSRSGGYLRNPHDNEAIAYC